MARSEGVYGPYRHGKRWRIVIVNAAGKSRAKSFPTERQARAKLKANQEEIEGERKTVEWAIHKYLEAEYKPGKTRQRVELALMGMMQPALHLGIKSLTPGRAESLYDQRIKTPVVRNGNETERTAATHQSELVKARKFSRWVHRKGYTKADAFAEVKPKGKASKGKAQLTRDEARKLYRACLADGTEGALGPLFALVFGMRSGEIISLTARQFDSDCTELVVRSSKGGALRRLAIPEPLRPVCQLLVADLAPEDPVFPERTRWWMRYHTKRMCDAAGVPRVPPHGLRGTHASLATDAHVTPQAVSQSLGHGGVAVTRDHYIRPGAVDEQVQARVSEVLS